MYIYIYIYYIYTHIYGVYSSICTYIYVDLESELYVYIVMPMSIGYIPLFTQCDYRSDLSSQRSDELMEAQSIQEPFGAVDLC